MPRIEVGEGLADAGATAAMDVSDGLLIDAERMARAAGVAIEIALGEVPLSEAARARLADDDAGRIVAATSGDDYELLIAAPAEAEAALFTLCERARVRLTRIGRALPGAGLIVTGKAGQVLTPATLGYEHGR